MIMITIIPSKSILKLISIIVGFLSLCIYWRMRILNTHYFFVLSKSETACGWVDLLRPFMHFVDTKLLKAKALYSET